MQCSWQAVAGVTSPHVAAGRQRAATCVPPMQPALLITKLTTARDIVTSGNDSPSVRAAAANISGNGCSNNDLWVIMMEPIFIMGQ